MITVGFQTIRRGVLLASIILLGSMPVFAQGTHGEAPPAPNNTGPVAMAPAAAKNIVIIPQGEMGAGTEGRMWADPPVPPKPRPMPFKLNITEHVKIAMRDGVKL